MDEQVARLGQGGGMDELCPMVLTSQIVLEFQWQPVVYFVPGLGDPALGKIGSWRAAGSYP